MESSTHPPASFTVAQVAEHNTRDDCWAIFYEDVYDLTGYGHPVDLCTEALAGTDQTAAYERANAVPNHDAQLLLDLVPDRRVGSLFRP